MNYRIRNAEPKDIDELIQLCAEHAEFEKAEFSAEGKAERLSEFLFSPEPPVFALVVETETGEILGYATFMPEFSTWDAEFYIYMDCLFLRPHARNFGIGEQIIREIARFAKNSNCKKMQWHTPSFNQGAIKFYYRIGATLREKTRFYLDENRIEELTR
jgi:GNAT superfamily N-acetyltransferase